MLRILLIDDEETVLDTISFILKTEGYQVVKARNGEEGIRKFDELPFDIVITDLIMPLCNGNDVARYVRSSGRSIPIIGITGTPEDVVKSCFDIVLKKPFSIKKLVGHIKEIENGSKELKVDRIIIAV